MDKDDQKSLSCFVNALIKWIMKTDAIKTKKIGRQLLTRIILFLLIICLMFFLPARTLKYYEAWGYIGIIFTCAAIAIIYFLKHDPELLERRMRTKERVIEQKWIIKIGYILFLPTFIIPGFDKYYGWSHIPVKLYC
jgi:NADH:ubiquinone oxidoreductase subunit 6 (subunit J)